MVPQGAQRRSRPAEARTDCDMVVMSFRGDD
jgi:hypothetical protein